ncbi:MAG: hypothetical protein LBP22_08185 [Deltaproteobacteria bacterium]|nr:hypothetical protein [Deltaproteobacteria bacterium]
METFIGESFSEERTAAQTETGPLSLNSRGSESSVRSASYTTNGTAESSASASSDTGRYNSGLGEGRGRADNGRSAVQFLSRPELSGRPVSQRELAGNLRLRKGRRAPHALGESGLINSPDPAEGFASEAPETFFEKALRFIGETAASLIDGINVLINGPEPQVVRSLPLNSGGSPVMSAGLAAAILSQIEAARDQAAQEATVNTPDSGFAWADSDRQPRR